MDEQEATTRFEEIIGGPANGFRMMRIYQDSQQAANSTCYSFWAETKTPAEIFRKRAKREGFSDRAIEFYLNHIV